MTLATDKTVEPRWRQRTIRSLLKWYKQENRDLPWRKTRDPYAVWLSEIMLQQTQVRSAIPYYERFLRALPTIDELARADLAVVLKLWEGLGYYARARNLHSAARQIVRENRGKFPNDLQTVSDLPGIGPYTAAAILSIAFDQDQAVVDGNVERVLSRLLCIDVPPRSREGRKVFRQLAENLLARGKAGIYNQALMELGALVCRPRNPICSSCPLQSLCRAALAGQQQEYPKKLPRRPRPHRLVAVGVVWQGDRLLIARRPNHAMLGGLWEFPGGKVEPGEEIEQAVVREVREEVGIDCAVEEKIGTIEHGYTHFSITLHAFHCRYLNGEARALGCSEWRWIQLEQLSEFAFPGANKKLFALLSAPPNWTQTAPPGF